MHEKYLGRVGERGGYGIVSNGKQWPNEFNQSFVTSIHGTEFKCFDRREKNCIQ
jgi:hypothetical protein